MIWSVSQSIGEMAILYPLPSAFVQWTNKFVDPAAGFALGWCYWFQWWITIANELAGLVTVLGFWPGSTAIPTAGWIAIFLVVIVLINICAVNYFAETEVVFAAIKFGWIFVVIISMIVISAGGAPKGGRIGFKYWDQTHGFTNGFKGFLDIMPTCVFAMSGSEACGLVAAETANPRKSVPRAVNSIWVRLGLFYVLGSLMVTITVSPYNKDLFGGSGTNASPFVIAYRDAGLEPLAHIMNFIIFISVLSTGSISGYSGARTLVGLSSIGMAPKVRIPPPPNLPALAFGTDLADWLVAANAKGRQDREAVVGAGADARHRRRARVPQRQPVGGDRLHVVLEPDVAHHALRMGYDLLLAHPHAPRVEGAGPVGGRAAVEDVDVPGGGVVGVGLVRAARHCRVLPQRLAPGRLAQRRELLCQLRLHHRRRHHLAGRAPVLLPDREVGLVGRLADHRPGCWTPLLLGRSRCRRREQRRQPQEVWLDP